LASCSLVYNRQYSGRTSHLRLQDKVSLPLELRLGSLNIGTFMPNCTVLSYQTTWSLYAKLHREFVSNYTVLLYYTARYFCIKQPSTLAQPHGNFPPHCKLFYTKKHCTPAVELHGNFIKITQYLHSKLHGTFM